LGGCADAGCCGRIGRGEVQRRHRQRRRAGRGERPASYSRRNPLYPGRQSSSNLAITALATDRVAGQNPQLFAQVHNYGDRDAEVFFSLRVDGELFSSERYTVPARGDLPILSRALPSQFTTLQAGLTLPAASTLADYLAADNNAYVVSGGIHDRRVLLMTQGNLFIEQVVSSLPSLQAFRGDINRPLPDRAFDVYVFDGWLPAALPDGDLLIINPPRSTSLFTVGEASAATRNPVVKRDDPRMIYVDFDDVNILKFRPLGNIDWADVLIRVEGGPLLVAGEVDGRQVAILTFDVRDPISAQDRLARAPCESDGMVRSRNAIAVANGLSVGDTLPVHPPFEATRFGHAAGRRATSLSVEGQTVLFAETGMPGLYGLELY
jgi:hypothetical protein